MQESPILLGLSHCSGGRGGIRTHEALADLPVFKTGALNRSATRPISTRQALSRDRARTEGGERRPQRLSNWDGEPVAIRECGPRERWRAPVRYGGIFDMGKLGKRLESNKRSDRLGLSWWFGRPANPIGVRSMTPLLSALHRLAALRGEG